MDDLKAMMDNVWNHPSIVQYEVTSLNENTWSQTWHGCSQLLVDPVGIPVIACHCPHVALLQTFNEGDMWSFFDVPSVVKYTEAYDPSRLVDTDSGGGANNLHIGSVNDIHDYPDPQNPQPSDTQYAMIGEFGGIGAFVAGKEWWPKQCHTYLRVATPAEEASTYINMTKTLLRNRNVSASVYTQITDVELECDGFLNYDRTNKFDQATTAAIAAANQLLITAPLD
jgi:hypothetical protein